MSNVVILFFKSVEEFDFAGDFAVLDHSVRSLNHAEIIDPGIRRETENEADVRTFRSLNRAKSAVMRRVHVAHFVAGAGAGETAGAEGGDGAQMLEFFQGVRLLHELRELVGGEEFLHPGLERLRRNELDRQRHVGVDGRHAVLDVSLDLSHADADFLLEKFPDETDAAGTQMVDVIGFGARGDVEMGDVRNNQNEVVLREGAAFDFLGVLLDAEAVVETEAADAGKVIALLVENGADEFFGVFGRGQIAVAQAAVDFDSGLVHGRSVVLGQSLFDIVLGLRHTAEESQDFVIGGRAEGAQESGDRKLPLAVDAHVDGAVEIGLQFYPSATARDDFGAEGLFTLEFLGGERNAGRTGELRHNHALDAGDNESAVVRHKRQVSHENLLLLLGLHDEVLQADAHFQWSLVREFSVLGGVFVELGLGQLEADEVELEFPFGKVLDGREFLEDFLESLLNKPFERIDLGDHQVGGLGQRQSVPAEILLYPDLIGRVGAWFFVRWLLSGGCIHKQKNSKHAVFRAFAK